MEGITVIFRELRNKERDLKDKISKDSLKEQILRQKIGENEYQISQLKQQIEVCKKKSGDMQKRIQRANEIPQDLLERRKSIELNSMKWLYSKCILIVEENLKSGLNNLFKCSAKGNGNRDAFKVYGLLLSACQQEPIVKKVTQSVEHKNMLGGGKSRKEVAKVYIEKAAMVTYSMLTLLPPLIVTVDPREYSDLLHDTNRLTWNESTKVTDELIYYRPILMYGNQLNVAVKGLVGNSTGEIGDQNSEILQKQQSIPQGETYSVISDEFDARGNTGNNCAVCGDIFDTKSFIDCFDFNGQQHIVHEKCYKCVCSVVCKGTLFLVGNQMFCESHLKTCKACQKCVQWKYSDYYCDKHGPLK